MIYQNWHLQAITRYNILSKHLQNKIRYKFPKILQNKMEWSYVMKCKLQKSYENNQFFKIKIEHYKIKAKKQPKNVLKN
jgi:hypothetical protein